MARPSITSLQVEVEKWFRSSQSVKSDIFIFPFFLLHFQQITSSDETLWSI